MNDVPKGGGKGDGWASTPHLTLTTSELFLWTWVWLREKVWRTEEQQEPAGPMSAFQREGVDLLVLPTCCCRSPSDQVGEKGGTWERRGKLSHQHTAVWGVCH